jgi:hypothetical protein
MLASLLPTRWWYLEIPRTGSTTIDRGLRRLFPHAVAIYQKHWPLLPPPNLRDALSLVSIRNPYSRAVSCWQFFTKPDEVSFAEWVRQRRERGFTDIHIEARPQSFWFDLKSDWSCVLRQEQLVEDFWEAVHRIDLNIPRTRLVRFNDINSTWLNRAKVRVKRDRPWQAYYDANLIREVRQLYADDFLYLDRFYSAQFPAEHNSTSSLR